MKSLNTFRLRDQSTITGGELRNAANLAFTFLDNGAVFAITHGGILINQVLGNSMDGSLGNIYLRRHRAAGITHVPVLGPRSPSRFGVGEGVARWEGAGEDLAYDCLLRPAPAQTMWFWTLRMRNLTAEPCLVDVVFGQDLGLATPAAVQSNELYTSQYIDHTVYQDDRYGYVVCSRQNQAQDGTFPWILHGCFEGAAGYLTDGFQFYGLTYRETNVPVALTEREFPNTTYQYEFAFPAVQTRPIEIPANGTAEVTFFAVFQADHPKATSPQDLAQIETAKQAFRRSAGTGMAPSVVTAPAATVFATAPLYPTQHLTADDLNRYFGADRRHVEEQDGVALSFFYGPENHVVLKAKELRTERPHGHILRSGRHLAPDENTLSLTAWMYGVFASHLAVGNTNFNKMLTISRNPLNALKSSGLRIFVGTPTGYALLAVPSAFEMDLSSARWIYRGHDATIVVRVWTSMDEPASFLEIAVEGTHARTFLISINVALGDADLTGGLVEIDEDTKRVTLIPAPGELMAQRYPEARFFVVPGAGQDVESIGGDGLLFADGEDRNNPYVVLETRPIRRFTLAITGNVLNGRQGADLAQRYAVRMPASDEARQESQAFWRNVRRNATLSLPGNRRDVARLDDTLRWYAHNAVIHFSTPYGLEQYSGAAWGTRDVCQGPVEFLLATRNFDAIRTTLVTVYAHQLAQTGDWPQWFMFGRYWDIYAPDSHADIVIWPLKALCDYLEATDDLVFLDEEIPFTDDETRAVSQGTASLFAHTIKQIDRMEQGCLPGTALGGYGRGDWEDTLQPADPAVRERWVSPWTVELMYQTLTRYASICERAGKPDINRRLIAFCRRIKEDFNRYLMPDGVVAGLVEFGPATNEYLLHPADTRTGVRYRLLPMTRGMISGMLTPEQMKRHLAIIHEHLMFPDGVRLMDRPVSYQGGTERLFRRAESAANFGREIGLQYVHAHLRYVEAMAAIGRPDEAYRGLLLVTPIAIRDSVPAAALRQSNAYFSSSDSAFRDRYEASQRFARIKSSGVPVKGGWRIYSSGPGLFIAELVLYGIRCNWVCYALA